ncbi:MAG: 16S rRNA (cytosine(1402)-N(4))-methyltransferase [Armatimonadetes bacterium Cent15-Ar3]|nr:MAG: 16S rRNA (cytosine(1402)-N(4))-methyltransferase [Armatimonadetes bacterium Cent15-Ar3]
MTTAYVHDPVMVDEILAALALKPGDVVVDGTLGLAGHSMRFIDAIRPGGVLVGLDWDESMLAIAKQRVGKPEGVTVHLVHSDFRDMKEVLVEYGLRPNGILLDLGLNSAQIEDPNRGITFKEDGPLDMRMDRSTGEPAAALLNRMSPQAIQDALEDFGDEKWAHRIAQKIVLRRKEQPLRTTNDLIECVLAAIPVNAREKRIHPATRTFQAVRILTNAEFDGLREAILDAASMLADKGNLAILSYHSGEDRIVKRAFQELAEEGFVLVDKKPRGPSEAEIGRNARSRSAKLRVIRKEVKL